MKTRNIFVSVTTLGVAALLVATGISPAMADTSPPAPGTSQATAVKVTPAEQAAAQAAAAQIQRFQSALTTTRGVYHFDAATAIKLGGDLETVEQVAVAVEADGGVVTGIAVPETDVKATKSATTNVVTHCYGSSNFSHQWFGYQIKVNSCTVARIIADINIGAGVVAIVSAILLAVPGVGTIVSVLGGVAAGLLAIGAGILGNCSADGDGTIIDFGWGVAWCANQ